LFWRYDWFESNQKLKSSSFFVFVIEMKNYLTLILWNFLID
jgi:hypothetical protein